MSSIISRENFEMLRDVLVQSENYTMQTPIVGVKGEIVARVYHFPSIYTEEGLDFVGNGFKTPQKFCDRIYYELDTNSLRDDNIIIVNYPVEVPAHLKKLFRKMSSTYILFDTQVGLRVLHNPDVQVDFVKLFATARNMQRLAGVEREMCISELEAALYLLLRRSGIVLPESIPVPELALSSVTEKPDKELIQELLLLLTRRSLPKKQMAQITKFFLLACEKPEKYIEKKGLDPEEVDADELASEALRDALRNAEMIFWSDWKFDTTDIEDILQKTTKEEFQLELPHSGICSRDFFPCIDKALAERGYELLNFNTKCDSYDFLVVHRKDTDRIIELSKYFGILIDRL